jgi:F-type H+-transporting ATPase subunit b
MSRSPSVRPHLEQGIDTARRAAFWPVALGRLAPAVRGLSAAAVLALAPAAGAHEGAHDEAHGAQAHHADDPAPDGLHGEELHGLAGHGAAAHGAHGGHEVPPVNWTDVGYKSKDVHGGELEPGEEAMAPPFVLALVNFGILLFLLGWKAAPPLRAYVRRRHDEVREALDEARKLHETARQKVEEYSKRIANVDREVAELVAQIRSDAEAERDRILEQSRLQAEAMKRDARERIAADVQRARLEIEREVVAAAVAAAEQLVRQKATPTDHKTLIESFIDDLASAPSAAVQRTPVQPAPRRDA